MFANIRKLLPLDKITDYFRQSPRFDEEGQMIHFVSEHAGFFATPVVPCRAASYRVTPQNTVSSLVLYNFRKSMTSKFCILDFNDGFGQSLAYRRRYRQ